MMQSGRGQQSVWRQLLRCMTAVAMLSMYMNGHTALAGGQIIDDISFYTDNKTTHITFSFSIPVHYQWHFPRTPSSEIMVSLLPIRGRLDQEFQMRGHVSIPDELKDVIDEIQLDGTEGKGILLLIHAKNQIKAEFRQSKNANTIIMSVSTAQLKNQPDTGCEDKPDGKKKNEQ